MKINKNADKIIEMIQNKGFDAYVVGGCVRDSIIGREPKDWDVCTNARPEQVAEIFSAYKVIPTGIKHGTVTVMLDEPFEITTYRVDGDYTDGRHPDEVTFTDNIIEDLARRDFTINAMAFNNIEGLIDPFEGLSDIKQGLIRCVGDPDKRFNEDGLRILRAIRFSSQLDYSLDRDTLKSIYTNKHLLENISAERKREELFKVIASNNAYKGLKLIEDLDIKKYIIEYNNYNGIDNLNKDIITRISYIMYYEQPEWATLEQTTTDEEQVKSHNKTQNSASSEFSQVINRELSRLKLSNKEVEDITKVVSNISNIINPNKPSILSMVSKVGIKNTERIIELQKSMGLVDETTIKMYSKIDLEKECYTIKHLEVNGEDLVELGIKRGPKIGETLKDILHLVIEGKIENNKKELMDYVGGIK